VSKPKTLDPWREKEKGKEKGWRKTASTQGWRDSTSAHCLAVENVAFITDGH